MTSTCCLYVAAARSSVTSDASPPFHRNWDDSETTQQKHYVGATSCHAISVNVINLPTHLYCTCTYWLADNLGTLFLRSDSALSSTATPSTSASTTPALKRFKVLSERLQQSGSADDRSQSCSSSTCATMHAQIDQYLHELLEYLEETAGSLFTPCPTCTRPSESTCITGLRGTGLLCVDGRQLATETNYLNISRFACSWKWTDLVWM